MGNKVDRYQIEAKMLKLRKEREKMKKEREEKCDEYNQLTGEIMIRKPIDDYIDRSVPPNQINNEIVIVIKGIKREKVKKKVKQMVVEEVVEEEEITHVPKNKKKFKNNTYCSYN